MPTPFERMWQSWNADDRAFALPCVTEAMAAEGVSRQVLDEALGLLLDAARAQCVDEAVEEIIVSLGDRLHGYCSPQFRIHTRDADATMLAAPLVSSDSSPAPTAS